MPAGNGGEKFQARVGDKAISLAVRDLLPLAMLVMIALAGYLFWQDARRARETMRQAHHEIYKAFQRSEAMTLRALEVLQYNLEQPAGERLPLTVARDEIRQREGPR